MNLYMLELTVSNLASSIGWYETLGLTVEKLDEANGFVLLKDRREGRLALKAGTPTASSVILHCEVEHLPADAKLSEEGYQSVTLTDPDGYRIDLFAWIR